MRSLKLARTNEKWMVFSKRNPSVEENFYSIVLDKYELDKLN